MRYIYRGLYNKNFVVWAFYVPCCLFYLGVGAFSGFYFGFKSDLPDLKVLESYRPNLITEVYSDDGRVLGEFAVERRYAVSYKEIPERLSKAILATEDKNFFTHTGVDLAGMLRAAYKNWSYRKLVAGGSTLTQQLTRQIFLSAEKTFDRKVREFILAQEIEHKYSKEQIFTLYCNVIYMGHGVYGFAAAADYYFGKGLDELALEECALLAALPKAPTKYSPYLNLPKAIARRNYVLGRMAAERFITNEAAEQAQTRPIVLKKQKKMDLIAPYFLEMVRQYLAKKYTTRDIWGGGLRVYTTLNLDMQRAANDALSDGLREYDRRHGWRGPLANILAESHEDLDTFWHDDWKNDPAVGAYITGLIASFQGDAARVKLGRFTAVLHPKDVAWTGKPSPKDLFQIGDLAVFKIDHIDSDEKSCTVSLSQTPEVQGSLVVIDSATGQIKALVGGYDYNASEFNRATRSLRQPGSAFKPFVYAASLEAGFKLDDKIADIPVSFRGSDGKAWAPHNYDKQFKGPITLRKALAESRNAATVSLASRLGIQRIIDVAQRFGITSPIDPYLPIVLGASEVTLLELTSAYAVFVNEGARAEPHFIKRIQTYTGVIKEDCAPEYEQVIEPDLADKMVELLRGVVQFGTATKAQALNYPVAGKTGTTNSFTDAWFVGFPLKRDLGRRGSMPSNPNPTKAGIPSVTCGVWVGFDDKRPLGDKETGARVALPVWIDFMKRIAGKEAIR